MHKAPALLTNHAATALAPSGARETGSMKMPAPIIVPTTKAPVIQKPIRPSVPLRIAAGSHERLGLATAASAGSGGFSLRPRLSRRGTRGTAGLRGPISEARAALSRHRVPFRTLVLGQERWAPSRS